MFEIKNKVRLIECFAGIGSQALAFERLGVDFERYKIVEWNISSFLAYKSIHHNEDNTDYSKEMSKEDIINYILSKNCSVNSKTSVQLKGLNSFKEDRLREIYNAIQSTHNLVNISSVKGEDLDIIDTDKYTYLLTYSFPCQDLSIAGKQKGFEKGSNTRSSLLWQIDRILKECENKPQILLMENVPTIVEDVKFKPLFDLWQSELNKLGYTNYVKVINSCDYGSCQNRRRCFMISILNRNHKYKFPDKYKKWVTLKDVIGEDYLKDKRKELTHKLVIRNKNFINKTTSLFDFSECKTNKAVLVGYIDNRQSEYSHLKHQDNHCYYINGIQAAVTTKASILCFYDNKINRCFVFNVKDICKMFTFPEKVYKVLKKYAKSKTSFLCGNSIVENVLIALFKQFYSDLRGKEIYEDINY